jgi:D-aminopeptidase
VQGTAAQDRPRARDLGIEVGVFSPGANNAISDVGGVLVGQVTVAAGDSVNTGVTAILPHDRDLFREPVPAAIYVANGFGKTVGIAQVQELGIIETPILLTCTLCVWRAADAMTDLLLAQPGMQDVRSINPVVGETNDGYLNDIRNKPVTAQHVAQALADAKSGPVEEGSVGAGRGTIAFGWKGGIGTSSRVLPTRAGGYAVGVLVQSNFGGILNIAGAPVGVELDNYAFRNLLDGTDADGSIMIVVAVDAPVDARQLMRIARRAMLGVGRTGGSMSHGSGDFVIAFSTHTGSRGADAESQAPIPDGSLSPIFQAVAEATEEAIYNSMLKATTVTSRRGTIEALDIDELIPILEQYGVRR